VPARLPVLELPGPVHDPQLNRGRAARARTGHARLWQERQADAWRTASIGFIRWWTLCRGTSDFSIARLFARGNPQTSEGACQPATRRSPVGLSGREAGATLFLRPTWGLAQQAHAALTRSNDGQTWRE
jgi:hypothetical protein